MADIRDLLHGLNNELSIAVLELELLLERSEVDEESRQSLLRALDACRRAAVGVRQGWAVVAARDGASAGAAAAMREDGA